MPQLIRPQEVKIITKDGELQVSIVLELNINLNGGGLDVTAQAREVRPVDKHKEEEMQWAIPDFGTSPKIDFGKRE